MLGSCPDAWRGLQPGQSVPEYPYDGRASRRAFPDGSGNHPPAHPERCNDMLPVTCKPAAVAALVAVMVAGGLWAWRAGPLPVLPERERRDEPDKVVAASRADGVELSAELNPPGESAGARLDEAAWGLTPLPLIRSIGDAATSAPISAPAPAPRSSADAAETPSSRRDVTPWVWLEAGAANDGADRNSRLAEGAAALGDPDPLIRFAGMDALRDAGTRATPLLGQVLLGDPEVELRLQALRLLADVGGAAAAVLLRDATGDDDPRVRTLAAALAPSLAADLPTAEEEAFWLAEGELLDPLEMDLRDPDPVTRAAALQDIHFLDDDEAVGFLEQVLSRDDDVSMREQALAALEYIGGDAAVDAMSAALGDDDVVLRGRAVEALWNAGSRTVPMLGQALLGDPDPAVRLRVVELLAADGSPAAFALLEAATSDDDEAVREAANRLLRR